MDYRNFRLAPIDDRRDEYSGEDRLGRLIDTLMSANPMMAHAATPDLPPITAIGQQAGLLDVEPAMREIQMRRAKSELADLLQARAMRAARGVTSPIQIAPVRLDRR